MWTTKTGTRLTIPVKTSVSKVSQPTEAIHERDKERNEDNEFVPLYDEIGRCINFMDAPYFKAEIADTLKKWVQDGFHTSNSSTNS